MGKAKVTYPRINCSVPGCRRGTTRCEPGNRIICAKCWSKAPKAMRERFSQAWRAYRSAERRDDERQRRLACAWVERAWEAILQVLTAPSSDADELPPLMGEELRKAGLL